MDMNCALHVHWCPSPTSNLYFPPLRSLQTDRQQRNERFGQSGSRAMGVSAPGFSRVREEFEGPIKKPRF